MCNVHQWVIVTVAAVQNRADTSSPVVTCPLQIRQPKHTNHKPVPPPPTAIYDPPSVGSPLRSENPFSAHAPRIRAHNKLRQGRRDILIVTRRRNDHWIPKLYLPPPLRFYWWQIMIEHCFQAARITKSYPKGFPKVWILIISVVRTFQSAVIHLLIYHIQHSLSVYP